MLVLSMLCRLSVEEIYKEEFFKKQVIDEGVECGGVWSKQISGISITDIRYQAFPLYFKHIQPLMPRADSRDPGQGGVFLS